MMLQSKVQEIFLDCKNRHFLEGEKEDSYKPVRVGNCE